MPESKPPQLAMTPFLPTITAGLRWVYETEQPGDAVLQHHGLSLPVVENRRFSFCPTGWAEHVVIVVSVAKVELGGPYEPPRNPLAPDELVAVTAALADLGADVVKTWNGHPSITGSLALTRPAHPSLVAAVKRYHAGCPQHRTVFCGSKVGCSWYRDGYARIVQPIAPARLQHS